MRDRSLKPRRRQSGPAPWPGTLTLLSLCGILSLMPPNSQAEPMADHLPPPPPAPPAGKRWPLLTAPLKNGWELRLGTARPLLLTQHGPLAAPLPQPPSRPLTPLLSSRPTGLPGNALSSSVRGIGIPVALTLGHAEHGPMLRFRPHGKGLHVQVNYDF